MANITLGHYELKNLRKGLAVKYEQTGQRLEYKKSRTQYMGLCRCIKDSNKKHEHKASISEDQLMSLFMDEQKTTFKNDFIDSCYLYAYGHTQEEYKNINEDQFNDWAALETKNNIETKKETSEAFEDELQKAQTIIIRQKKLINSLKKAAIAVASCFIIGSGAYFLYQKYYAPIVWTVSMPWDGETSSRAEMVRRIAKKLESTILIQRNRKFELQIYADGRLPKSKGIAVSSLSELFFAVGRNEIQMAHFSPYYLENTDLKAAMFFGSIPGGMNSMNLTGWMTEGDGQKLRDSLYTTQNVMSITCGDTGEQMGGWFKTEIKKITDFNGLRFRIGSPIGKAVLKSFGSDTSNTTVSEGQIALHLATGKLDGAEWICVYDDYRLGLAGLRDFNFYYISNWHEPALLNDMLINKSAYDALPENIQKELKIIIIEEGGKLEGILHEKKTVDMYLTEIRAKKIKVDSFPREVESALRLRAIEKVSDFVKENKNKPLLKEIYISYQTYCKNNAPLDCDCKKWKTWDQIVK